MCSFIILFLINMIIVITSTENMLGTPETCSSLSVEKHLQTPFYGWPYYIPCLSVFEHAKYRSCLLMDCNSNQTEEIYSSDSCLINVTIQCTVLNKDGMVVFNSSFDQVCDTENFYSPGYGYVTKDIRTPYLQYTLRIANLKNQKCIAIDYDVQVIPSDCSSTRTETFAISSGTDIRPTCEAKYSEMELSLFEGVNYQWLYKCSRNFSSIGIDPVNNQLRISSVGFEHAGVYTCEATYKGFKRYLYSYQLCIQYPQPSSQLAITCKKTKLQVSVGEDVEQVCTVYYGKGSLINFGWSVKLRKKTPSASHSTSIDCPQKQTYDINNKTSTISCIQKPTNHCIATAPSLEKQKKKPDAFVEVRIKMKNFNKENYGLYTLAAYSIASNVKRLSKTFEIVPDPTPGLLSQTTAAGIAIGVVSLLLILICAVIYNSLYTRVCFKRFFGRLTKDDKPYGAFLAYNFSHHSMDKFTKNLVQDWIPRIRGSLEELGYHVFDEHKDDWLLQDRADNLWKAIKQCHRVVIFLNHGFVNDDWNSFVIHKGLEAMIQSGCKIVFILPPGIQEYLKQNSGNQTLCRTAERAIKINRFIQLAAKPNMTFLKLALEDAMPKLKKTSLNWDPVTRCCKCKNKEIHEESRQKSDKKTTHNYNNNNNKHFQNV